MANSDRPVRGAAPLDDSKDRPPLDRDQQAVSAVRAESKAEEVEAAATRPLGGADSARAEPVTGRDHLQGSAERAGSDGLTGGPGNGAGEQSDERRRRVAESAYYKAEQRGFSPGGEDGDWFDAEKELDGPGK